MYNSTSTKKGMVRKSRFIKFFVVYNNIISPDKILNKYFLLTFSPKTLERKAIEFSHRDKSFSEDVKFDEVVCAVKAKIDELVKELTPKD